jgi:BirA family biotin operon repressor/biotin-[acetyl-CoA-carboxylase] ligase
MPEPLAFQVLRLLSDQEFRSGEALAQALGVTRATVWNALEKADALGVTVHRVRGSGYRLAAPITWLDAGVVRAHLGECAPSFSIRVVDEVDSTSSRLLAGGADATPGAVLAAERQTVGRGRAGRPWYSSVGGALTFSMLWRFAAGASALGGASLAVAVAVIRALMVLGISGAQVKWPNDIVHSGCKLAGILIELRGDALGPTDAVIGIGMNVAVPLHAREDIDQPVIDLDALAGAVDRNRLLAAILRELHAVLTQFEVRGFESLRDEWIAHHAYQNREVEVASPGGRRVVGMVRGIGAAGELILEAGGTRHIFLSGEVRLRSIGAAPPVAT